MVWVHQNVAGRRNVNAHLNHMDGVVSMNLQAIGTTNQQITAKLETAVAAVHGGNTVVLTLSQDGFAEGSNIFCLHPGLEPFAMVFFEPRSDYSWSGMCQAVARCFHRPGVKSDHMMCVAAPAPSPHGPYAALIPRCRAASLAGSTC